MSKAYEEIFEYLNEIRVIDSHEHLPANESLREQETDILREYCRFILPPDLFSAGYKNFSFLMDATKPLMERWLDVEPYWEMARHTACMRTGDLSASIIYGVDGIRRETIELANERFQSALKGKKHYEYVLKEITKSDTCIKETLIKELDYDIDSHFHTIALRLDNMIFPRYGSDVLEVEKASGIKITSMDDWLDAALAILEHAKKTGLLVALKSQMAYHRSLVFEHRTKSEAEAEFNKIFKPDYYAGTITETYHIGPAFHDYMFHFLLRWCSKNNMPFQIHTGLQEGGYAINNGNPTQLVNLFKEYPDVKFDLLHIGYPFEHNMYALLKLFPNVYTNLTCVPVMDPKASTDFLIRALDLVPYNKITAYGGDISSVDLCVGNYHLTKMCVAEALAYKVEVDKLFDIDRAKLIGQHLFYQNPYELYQLKNVLK